MANNSGLSLTLQQLTELLGTVSLVPMGNWNANTPYQKLNIVNSNGGSYIAKKANQNIQPTVTSGWQEVWMPIGAEGQQGASVFHTMAASGTSVAVSSLQPASVTPLVGDAVVFPNGDVRQITAVSGSTVTLGDVMFSLKGDPGIGGATLSNIDGDSHEDGFTQQFIKGGAQAKNYYNLAAFDTYVSNGDGTGVAGENTQYYKFTGSEPCSMNNNSTGCVFILSELHLPKGTEPNTNILSNILQSTPSYENGIYDGSAQLGISFGTVGYSDRIVIRVAEIPQTVEAYREWLGKNNVVIQYKTDSKYSRQVKVIDKQPIRPANQEECLYWHKEWRRGLNLIDLSKIANSSANGITKTVYSDRIVLSGEATAYTEFEIFNDLEKVKGKTITLNGRYSYNISVEGRYTDAGGKTHYFNGESKEDGKDPVYIPNNATAIKVYVLIRSGATAYDVPIYPMLVEGSYSYPPEPYHGEIVREKDLSGIQLFPEGVNPAQTIGGDWEDLGTVTVGSNTLHAYQKVSGGN